MMPNEHTVTSMLAIIMSFTFLSAIFRYLLILSHISPLCIFLLHSQKIALNKVH